MTPYKVLFTLEFNSALFLCHQWANSLIHNYFIISQSEFRLTTILSYLGTISFVFFYYIIALLLLLPLCNHFTSLHISNLLYFIIHSNMIIHSLHKSIYKFIIQVNFTTFTCLLTSISNVLPNLLNQLAVSMFF